MVYLNNKSSDFFYSPWQSTTITRREKRKSVTRLRMTRTYSETGKRHRHCHCWRLSTLQIFCLSLCRLTWWLFATVAMSASHKFQSYYGLFAVRLCQHPWRLPLADNKSLSPPFCYNETGARFKWQIMTRDDGKLNGRRYYLDANLPFSGSLRQLQMMK